MKKKTKIIFYSVVTIAYMALIMFLSVSKTSDTLMRWHIDKFMHVGAYLVMGVLGYRTCIRIWSSLRPVTVAVAVFFLCSIFGVVIEFYQGMTGYRVFSYGDMGSNALGALIGVVVGVYLGGERSREDDIR
ncbi:MAG: VanZ family protein [Deltaproteobacteria bacterium]|nr:VanZ family protein [Deltaproteobacteria bacterium]